MMKKRGKRRFRVREDDGDSELGGSVEAERNKLVFMEGVGGGVREGKCGDVKRKGNVNENEK